MNTATFAAAGFGAPDGSPGSVPASPSLPLPAFPGGARPLDMGPARVSSLPSWFKRSDGEKIRWLRDYAEQYGRDPNLRFFVHSQIFGGDRSISRDYQRQSEMLLRWVQEHVTYLNEPGEILQSPWVTIKQRVGDCDDVALLLAALATSVGLPWRFVLAGKKKGSKEIVRWVEPWPARGTPRTPRGVVFAHIYLCLGDKPFAPQKWTSAEPTIRGAPLGYDPAFHGPLADSHMRGRWTGRLPELGGPEGAEGAQTESALLSRKRAQEVLVAGLAGGLSIALGGLISQALKKTFARKRRRK